MTINELYDVYKLNANMLMIEVEDQTDNTRKKVSFGDIVKDNDKSINRYGLTKPLLGQVVANIYCDAEEADNQPLRDKSYAALVCLYWYKIHEWARTSQSLNLRYTDFADWLVDSINDALYYRSWRPKRIDQKKLKKEKVVEYIDNPQYRPDDPVAADRSINHFCGCKRAKEYDASNKQKRACNYGTVSVDDSIDEDGHSMLDRNEALAVEGPKLDIVREIVQSFVDKDRVVEGLVIDLIAHEDCFKTTENDAQYTKYELDEDGKVTEELVDYTEYHTQFDPRKLVKYLKTMTKNEVHTFSTKYGVENEEELETTLSSTPNAKLYKLIDKTLAILRADPSVKEDLA